MPQAQACIDEIQKEARNYNRIYVSSVHKVPAENFCCYFSLCTVVGTVFATNCADKQIITGKRK
jgi:hypothetical protein